MVLGSGRTWPHDFRFLVGFLSVDSAAGDVEASSAGESSRVSATDCGVMTSMGFMASSADGVKRGYRSSPGADMKDSAGEFSNLTWGAEVGAAAGEAVLLFSQDAMMELRVRTSGVARDGVQFRVGVERGAQSLSRGRCVERCLPKSSIQIQR